jgi:sugar-specific transcriptional regulator TrmB
MTNIKHILKNLGFSTTSESIYSTLLKKDGCSIAELSQITGIHRPSIYKAIPELIEANLLTKSTKGKRTIYVAESPAVISSITKKHTEKIEDEIPGLLEIFNNKNKNLKTTLFEGKHGIETAYEQLINDIPKDGNLYRFESPSEYEKNRKYYPSLYWKRASRIGDINKYVITNKKTNEKRHKSLNRFSKAVDTPFEENITHIISDKKVLFIDFSTETAVMIENERFASFQKSIFKLLYKKLD